MDNTIFENRLTKVEERAKSNTKRLDNCEKRLTENEKTLQVIAALATKQESMEKDVAEVKKDVKQLLGEPGKKWLKLIEAIIYTVAAGIVAFVFFKLGMTAK